MGDGVGEGFQLLHARGQLGRAALHPVLELVVEAIHLPCGAGPLHDPPDDGSHPDREVQETLVGLGDLGREELEHGHHLVPHEHGEPEAAPDADIRLLARANEAVVVGQIRNPDGLSRFQDPPREADAPGKGVDRGYIHQALKSLRIVQVPEVRRPQNVRILVGHQVDVAHGPAGELADLAKDESEDFFGIGRGIRRGSHLFKEIEKARAPLPLLSETVELLGILHDPLEPEDLSFVVPDGPGGVADPDRGPVPSDDLDLVPVNEIRLPQLRHPSVPGFRVHIVGRNRHGHERLGVGIAQEIGQSVVGVEHPTLRRRPVHPHGQTVEGGTGRRALGGVAGVGDRIARRLGGGRV